MPLDELQHRVEEAERLLRTARQLAEHDLADPRQCERAGRRISSLIAEAQSLFPGLGDSAGGEADEAEEVDASEDDQADEAEATGGTEPDEQAEEAEDQGEDDGGGQDEDAEDDEEWDVDVDKLAAAIQNEALMAQIPEAHRAEFKAMAERVIDAYRRQALYERVAAAFEVLDETTRQGAEHARQLLATMLTWQELAAKYQA